MGKPLIDFARLYGRQRLWESFFVRHESASSNLRPFQIALPKNNRSHPVARRFRQADRIELRLCSPKHVELMLDHRPRWIEFVKGFGALAFQSDPGGLTAEVA